MTRLALATLAVVTIAASAAQSVMAVSRAPVIVVRHPTFGRVLFTPGRRALYYWAVEKDAGRIVCTGACAKLWPPLIVRSRAAVPLRIAGATGRFGVVRRPDGRLQVTRNGVALYTYRHDPRNQVLCDNVNRWFVARV